MQGHCADACRSLALSCSLLGFRLRDYRQTSFSASATRVSCSFAGGGKLPHGRKRSAGGEEAVRAKKKDNVWSIDNELASRQAEDEKSKGLARRRKRVKGGRRRNKDSTILVSAAMLMEIETVLQTQEPVIRPSWDTFASSLSGIWKGVGAVFSPFTAELEPIAMDYQNKNLFDCYTLSRIEKVLSQGNGFQIHRKTNWVALNPHGEAQKHGQASHRSCIPEANDTEVVLPSYESFDLSLREVLEEDSISMEPGLVFFEDGSYSRGPVIIPVREYDESKYFLSPTFKFEQCLVKGCHKRLRIVHTIEFNEGGANIQITRLAIYEEEWVSPVNLSGGEDAIFNLKPISQRRRTQPSELAGSWKVFEVSAAPIFSDAEEAEQGCPPFVYLCMETLKKRSLPGIPSYFGEEEVLDMNDVTVLWLPGGVTAYVDVNKEGVLCIGVGWYSDEGINLVMERDYGMDGKLKEVRWKSEVQRRWNQSP
ncbi:hypothetical protein AXF42_Ash006373 [Apostasia shenzhenica]|uniref:DUF3598 domain-containing protein n=1 Tax=Apostasia shenzhenica TaxID=1088818 RepID=A0A2I0AYY2_9ASPA|nr:hypothetical protein AXF42_Ash006373 [Apostasia shenzhenica]